MQISFPTADASRSLSVPYGFGLPSTPPSGYPRNKSSVSWTFSTTFAAPPRDCRQISPGIWINVNQRIRNGANSTAVVPPIRAQSGHRCHMRMEWNRDSVLYGRPYTVVGLFLYALRKFRQLQRWISGISAPPFIRDRADTHFDLDATCSGTLTSSYLSASSTQSQRYQWPAERGPHVCIHHLH